MEIIVFVSYKLIFVITYIFKGLKSLLQKEVYLLIRCCSSNCIMQRMSSHGRKICVKQNT